MKKKKKIWITSLIAVGGGGVVLYSLLKKKPTSEIMSLGEIHKNLDKMIQGGGGKEEEMAYMVIDEITGSAKDILSKYPSDNLYLGYIRKTLGI